jgi:molybdenum cofactor biosynthesis enzyme
LQNILDLAKDNLTTEEIKNTLLLTINNEGNTAWHLAALKGNTVALQNILNLAKEYFTTEEIKNILPLASNIETNNA